jgi:hypothetical protein
MGRSDSVNLERFWYPNVRIIENVKESGQLSRGLTTWEADSIEYIAYSFQYAFIDTDKCRRSGLPSLVSHWYLAYQ